MAPRNKKTKKTRGQMRGVTRKVAKGKVLDVRSPKDIKAFERLVVNGPLTLVYINAKWCGACHQFTDKVWNHLVNMKNKKMNVASVDSEMVGKIPSLANVPRKFYPTLMLVGEDKKPATFLDEDGNPTAAMPRNASLEEDKEAFSSLVQNPTLANSTMPKSLANMTPETAQSPESPQSPETAQSPQSPQSPETVAMMTAESLPPEAIASQPRSTMKSKSMRSRSNSAVSQPIRLGLSPFPNSSKVPSMLESKNTPRVPNVASDILSSTNMRNIPKAPLKGGNLLKAINAHTASLKALLKLRSKQ